jgi:hypothetical protein
MGLEAGLCLPSFFMSQCPRLPATRVISAILIRHDLRAIEDLLEGQPMQSEEQAHNVRAEVHASAEPLPQHAAADPMVPTSTGVPGRRLTTRELARRRRKRLLELIQHQGKPPASQ